MPFLSGLTAWDELIRGPLRVWAVEERLAIVLPDWGEQTEGMSRLAAEVSSPLPDGEGSPLTMGQPM